MHFAGHGSIILEYVDSFFGRETYKYVSSAKILFAKLYCTD